MSNSTQGNRQLRIFDSRADVHTPSGGIDQDLAMGIGAAISAVATGFDETTFCLAGDGDFILNLGELVTMVQGHANLIIVLVNGRGYGVIKNIRDAQHGGRRHYVGLYTPNYAALTQSLQLRHHRVPGLADVGNASKEAASGEGPFLMEVDILSIDSFKTISVGPPVNQQAKGGRGKHAAVCAADGTTVVA